MPAHKKTHTRLTLPFLLLLIFLGIATLLYALGPLRTPLDSLFTPNYAEQTAKPIEKALVEAGAVKKCSSGDDGIGGDVGAPRYTVIFEVPGDRQAATELARKASKSAGYDLVDAVPPSNPGSDKFYTDHNNPSSYSALESGNSKLIATVFGSSIYDANNAIACTLIDIGSKSPRNSTTVDLTVSLPDFKH